jgi:hypothetical protein
MCIIVLAGRGGGEKLSQAGPAREQLIVRKKPTSQLFLYIDQKILFFFYHKTLYMKLDVKYKRNSVWIRIHLVHSLYSGDNKWFSGCTRENIAYN